MCSIGYSLHIGNIGTLETTIGIFEISETNSLAEILDDCKGPCRLYIAYLKSLKLDNSLTKLQDVREGEKGHHVIYKA